MDLTELNIIKLSQFRVILVTLLENTPQIIIQIIYLITVNSNNNDIPTIIALLSSVISLVFSMFVCWLQQSVSIIENQYAIIIKCKNQTQINQIKIKQGLKRTIRYIFANCLHISPSIISVNHIIINNNKNNQKSHLTVHILIAFKVSKNNNNQNKLNIQSDNVALELQSVQSISKEHKSPQPQQLQIQPNNIRAASVSTVSSHSPSSYI